MSNLADSLLAVGDSEALARGDLDSVLIAGSSDGLTVQAEVDVVVARPGVAKRNVGQQVVVAILCDAIQAGDGSPPESVVSLILACSIAADLVHMHLHQLQPAATTGQQLVVRVVAGKPRGICRITHHDRAIPRSLGRDTHRRAVAHASLGDSDCFVI